MSTSGNTRTEANQVLETFAELYLDEVGLGEYSVDELRSIPEEPIETYPGWESDSDEFWRYKSEVTDEIDELAGRRG